jgi:hypothetical protein
MPRSHALSHVAVSVPPGTLTDDYRDRVLEFYGSILGWREMDQLRLPDRMTIAVGKDCYINVRERGDDAATYGGYDHFGVLVDSEDDLRQLWGDLQSNHPEVTLRPISEGEGALTFRLHYLLPVAVEVQFFG